MCHPSSGEFYLVHVLQPVCAPGSRISIGGGTSSKKLLSAAGSKLASGARVTGELLTSAGDGARQIMKQAGAVLPKFLDGQTPTR